MKRDLAAELSQLFSKSKKVLTQDQVLQSLPKLSLDSLLNVDDSTDTTVRKVTVPKVSLLKKEKKESISKDFVKRTRKGAELPKVLQHLDARAPSPQAHLKVCMVGRKLESPIRSLKGFELESDPEEEKECQEKILEDIHDEILDPILVVEEEEETKEMHVKKLKDVDDLFKKYANVLNQKNMELQSSRGSPGYVTNFEFSSSLELFETESLKRLDQVNGSMEGLEQDESCSAGYAYTLDDYESCTESDSMSQEYSSSYTDNDYDSQESFSQNEENYAKEAADLKEEESLESLQDYSDKDELHGVLSVKPVKLAAPKHKKVLKKEKVLTKQETKKPNCALLPLFSPEKEDDYKPKRDIEKYAAAVNFSLEFKPETQNTDFIIPENTDEIKNDALNMDRNLRPETRHIQLSDSRLARGSTALGMNWDPSDSPKDYPVRISEYAKTLSEKKDRALFSRGSNPNSPIRITSPQHNIKSETPIKFNAEMNEKEGLPGNLTAHDAQFKSRKPTIISTPLEIVEETEGELYEQKQNNITASSDATNPLCATQEPKADIEPDENLKYGGRPSPSKGKRRSSVSINNRRFSIRRRSLSEPNAQKTKMVKEEKEDPLELKVEEVYENPKEFYLNKRRQSLGLRNEKDPSMTTSQEVLDMNRNDGTQSIFGSVSSIPSSVFQSIESVFSRVESKEILNLPNLVGFEQNLGVASANGALNQLLAALGFLRSENSFFDQIHDRNHRALLYSPFEIYKYRTMNDIGTPYDAYTEMPVDDEEILVFESDPGKELERLNFLIKSSPAPVPANFRRRGYVLLRGGKYEMAIADFDKSLAYDPFNSEAFWFRHQLYLKLNNVELAIKDLDSLTDGNKSHLGAFDTKARIYKELGLTKLAIANYSSVIRLKPDIPYGYYERACLYEKEQDIVYANEDFKVVRELDPMNQHAIYNFAIYNFQKQLWEDAIEAFSNLISLSSGNGLGYLYRGRANAAISRWDEALEDLSRCIQMLPDNSQAFFHRGCLLKDRNIDQAIQDFSTSLLLDDSSVNSDAFYHRAQLYAVRNEKVHALMDYKMVVELNPKKSSAYLELGILNMATSKDHHQSLHYLDEAIKMDPRQLQGYLSRAELYHIMYNNSLNEMKVPKKPKKTDTIKKDISEVYAKKSIQDYSRAIHSFPGNYLLYLYRGRLLLKVGRMKDATSDFHTAFELNAGIAQTFMQRALVLSFQRKYDQIVNEFDTKAKYESITDSAVYLLIAKARVKCNDNRGALRDLDDARRIRHRDPVIYLQRGICFENLLEFNHAIDEFTDAIAINPHFAKAYYHRGMCSMKFKKDGLQDLNQAISLDRGYFEAYLTRATYFYNKKKFKAAIADCDIALKLEPTSIHAHIMRGCCRKEVQKYELAIADFTKSIESDSGCYQAYFNRGLTYEALHDFQNAIKDYSVMILLSNDFKGYKNRGLLYWNMGDANNAILDLSIASELDPTDEEIKSLRGLALHSVSRLDDSMEVYNRAIDIHPTNVDLLLGRGNVHLTLNMPAMARRDYLRALHLRPTCLQALINVGYTFKKENLYKRAWNVFTYIIAMNPLFHAAYEGRAIINLAMKNAYGALLDISKAIELNPKNAEYITNRGIIYQHLGDCVSALQNFKIAIEVNPKYGLAYFNAANMYFSQKLWEVALKYYDKALEINERDFLSLMNRGLCRILQGDKGGAKSDFKLAADLQPTCTDALFNQASMLFSENYLDEAEKAFSKVIQLAPDDLTAYKMRGEIHSARSNWTEAITDYVKSQ